MSNPDNYLGVFPAVAPVPQKAVWLFPYRICAMRPSGRKDIIIGSDTLDDAEEGAQRRARGDDGAKYFVLDLTGSGPQEIEVET